MKKNLPKLMKKRKVKTPMVHAISESYQTPSPYGNVLIMSPWNYPVLLSLDPLIDALAAGNTVILKPSSYAPATAMVLKKMLEDCFEPELVTVVTGGRKENQALLEQRFLFQFPK